MKSTMPENKKKNNKQKLFNFLKKKADQAAPQEDLIESLARNEEEEEGDDTASVSSFASSASAANESVYSSRSSGRYSGSSLGSAGSVPRDKSFRILRESKAPTGFGGLSDAEMEEAEKADILARLYALKSRGVVLSKNFTPRSSLAALRMEMGRIEHQEETSRSVLRLRRWLLAGVSGAQYLTNAKFAPKFCRGKLNGFSDYILGSIEDFDPIFEKMSEKYPNVIGVGSSGNPILDLLFLLLTQMLMFVFMQHKSGTKPPSEDELRRDHPELLRSIAAKMAEDMLRAREAAAGFPMAGPSFEVPFPPFPAAPAAFPPAAFPPAFANPYDVMAPEPYDPAALQKLHPIEEATMEPLMEQPRRHDEKEESFVETFPVPRQETEKTVEITKPKVNRKKKPMEEPQQEDSEKVVVIE